MARQKSRKTKGAKGAFSKADLGKFHDVLLALRNRLADNVSYMEDQALKSTRPEAAGDLSSMPIHMADLGTDNFDQELLLDMIQAGEAEVRDIDDALQRINGGAFGLCEECQCPIPRARLEALPYARLCIDCKRKQEKSENSLGR